MKNKQNSQDQEKQAPARGGLRLIQCDKPDAQAEVKERPKNPFVEFMTAYADAIDRDVKTILEL